MGDPSRGPAHKNFPQFRTASIFLCMRCEKPTYFEDDNPNVQVPPPPYGNEVMNLPDTIKPVYAEARNCMLVAAYTSAALMCRKILMNVAVHEGAPENLKFVEYVEFFKQKNYIPPKGEKWIDFIRQKGNEGTHEIPQISKADAEQVIKFSETILTLVFEFPNRVS